jgi:hypothetical protein
MNHEGAAHGEAPNGKTAPIGVVITSTDKPDNLSAGIFP